MEDFQIKLLRLSRVYCIVQVDVSGKSPTAEPLLCVIHSVVLSGAMYGFSSVLWLLPSYRARWPDYIFAPFSRHFLLS